MVNVDPVSYPGYSSLEGPAQNPVQSESQNVDKNEFLKLLVAQLQYQDPLNPLKSEEFLTQLATFNSLEQLMSINRAVTKLADVIPNGVPGPGTDQSISSE